MRNQTEPIVKSEHLTTAIETQKQYRWPAQVTWSEPVLRQYFRNELLMICGQLSIFMVKPEVVAVVRRQIQKLLGIAFITLCNAHSELWQDFLPQPDASGLRTTRPARQAPVHHQGEPHGGKEVAAPLPAHTANEQDAMPAEQEISPAACKAPGKREGRGRRRKWTHELRVLVFSRIRERFGPKSVWDSATYPRSRRDEYYLFLDELAVELRELMGDPNLTRDAVENQVKWSFATSRIRHKSHYQNMVLNTAAALEAGFLTSQDLPGQALLERESR